MFVLPCLHVKGIRDIGVVPETCYSNMCLLNIFSYLSNYLYFDNVSQVAFHLIHLMLCGVVC